ncbi:MAG: hypothetical protein WKF89_01945 [Chitinophagaceae bacterium]
MNIPTINEFNKWPLSKKQNWIEVETAGSYREYRRDQGYFPFITYEAENVSIVYQVNKNGNLIEATAMTVNEALDRLTRFERASKAMHATN